MPRSRGRAQPPPRKKTPGRTASAKSLKQYRDKRRFDKTPEPGGTQPPTRDTVETHRFTIQKHDATRLHYDLRLEVNGILKSWAIPKGPSLDPRERRLAVRTEDHPIEYLTFEGVIPQGEYGAGPVIVWDTGEYRNITTNRQGKPVSMNKAVEGGNIKVWLQGQKLRGGFALVRTATGTNAHTSSDKEQWLLIKHKDDHAISPTVSSRKKASQSPSKPPSSAGAEILKKRPESVKSGKTIEDLGAPKRRSRTPVQSAIAGKRQKKPEWIAPMLATLADKPPSSNHDQWLYEYKYDGFRALAFRAGDTLHLLSRNGKDLADRFPEVAQALSEQALDDFIIDGEIVAMRNNRPSFSALQTRLKPTTVAAATRGGVKLRFYIFDLLYAAGHDARQLPLIQRKELLARAIDFRSPLLHYSTHEVPPRGDGHKLLQSACQSRWEGLIAKRAGDPYRSGRGRSWLKLKCSTRQEFVIGGYTDPQGSREAFGALLIGYYHQKMLLYAGKVGTGYSDKVLREILTMINSLERPTSPFAPDAELPGGRARRGIHFVQPKLVCEVAFTEWTDDYHIRHPRFLGLRPDKDPNEVRREETV